VFFGRIVHSKSLTDLEILPCAGLGVNEQGTIQFLDKTIGSARDACAKYQGFENATCITLKPLQFLFPGLIDSHLHAPQWPNLAIGMEASYENPIHR
jgi:guanine deaminase